MQKISWTFKGFAVNLWYEHSQREKQAVRRMQCLRVSDYALEDLSSNPHAAWNLPKALPLSTWLTSQICWEYKMENLHGRTSYKCTKCFFSSCQGETKYYIFPYQAHILLCTAIKTAAIHRNRKTDAHQIIPTEQPHSGSSFSQWK